VRALAATIALGLVLAVPSARAEGCAITATPEPGWPGASLFVTGTGFTPAADITVILGGMPIYDGFIDPQGGFEIEVRIPNPFPSGEAGLGVIDHTGVCQATMPYAVGDAPKPAVPTAIPAWALVAFVLMGAGLGLGLAGVAIHARPSSSGDA
jgi:hypothetical protein